MNEFEQKITEYEGLIESQNNKIVLLKQQIGDTLKQLEHKKIVIKELEDRTNQLEEINLKSYEEFQTQQKEKEESLQIYYNKLLKKKEKNVKYLENTIFEMQQQIKTKEDAELQLQQKIQSLEHDLEQLKNNQIDKNEYQNMKQKCSDLAIEKEKIFNELQQVNKNIKNLQITQRNSQQQLQEEIEEINYQALQDTQYYQNEINKLKLKLVEAEKKQGNSHGDKQVLLNDQKITIIQHSNSINNFDINEMDEMAFESTPDRKKSFLGFDFNDLSKGTSFSRQCSHCDELEKQILELEKKQQKIDNIYEKYKNELDKANEDKLKTKQEYLELKQSYKDIRTNLNPLITSCNNLNQSLDNSSLFFGQQKRYNSYKDLFNVQKDFLTRIEELEKSLKFQQKMNTNLNQQINKIEKDYKQQLMLMY